MLWWDHEAKKKETRRVDDSNSKTPLQILFLVFCLVGIIFSHVTVIPFSGPWYKASNFEQDQMLANPLNSEYERNHLIWFLNWLE